MEMKRLLDLLNRMESLQKEFFSELRCQLGEPITSAVPNPGNQEKLMNRLEVQAYLKISNTTYNRKVREGKLKPLRLPGGHKYYKSSLLHEFQESKRRGRV